MSEIDDNSLVIIIFCKVNKLLEVVNIVVNWILGLVPAGSFQPCECHELLVLPVLEVVPLVFCLMPGTLFAKWAAWCDLKKDSTQWMQAWSFRKRSLTIAKVDVAHVRMHSPFHGLC